MDMAFVNAINASTQLPAARPVDVRRDAQLLLPRPPRRWRWPIKLLGLAPDVGLQPAAVRRCCSALTATAVFTLRGDAVGGGARARRARAARRPGRRRRSWPSSLRACSATSPACAAWLDAADPPSDYAWFDPSRVIPDTINEFPSFSFLLGDLHAHVLALPFTRARARRSRCRSRSPGRAATPSGAARPRRSRPALAIGALYAINSWSYPVAAGLLVARGGRPGCATRARAGTARLRARLARGSCSLGELRR